MTEISERQLTSEQQAEVDRDTEEMIQQMLASFPGMLVNDKLRSSIRDLAVLGVLGPSGSDPDEEVKVMAEVYVQGRITLAGRVQEGPEAQVALEKLRSRSREFWKWTLMLWRERSMKGEEE